MYIYIYVYYSYINKYIYVSIAIAILRLAVYCIPCFLVKCNMYICIYVYMYICHDRLIWSASNDSSTFANVGTGYPWALYKTEGGGMKH